MRQARRVRRSSTTGCGPPLEEVGRDANRLWYTGPIWHGRNRIENTDICELQVVRVSPLEALPGRHGSKTFLADQIGMNWRQPNPLYHLEDILCLPRTAPTMLPAIAAAQSLSMPIATISPITRVESVPPIVIGIVRAPCFRISPRLRFRDVAPVLGRREMIDSSRNVTNPAFSRSADRTGACCPC